MQIKGSEREKAPHHPESIEQNGANAHETDWDIL
jgi:hypothetical protein